MALLAPLIKLTFVLAVAGSLVLLGLWTGLMAYRLLFPDREVPLVDRWTPDREVGDPVGVREIREQEESGSPAEEDEYLYSADPDGEGWLEDRSDAIPPRWAEDLWRRRN